MNSTFAKKLPFTAKLFAGVFAAGLVVAATTGCSVEPNEEPDTAAASENADESFEETSQAISNNNCNDLNVSGVKGGAFRGGGRCCRTLYNTRGEAGGYCAKQLYWVGGSQCKYEVRFCGGWGCANHPEYLYSAPCR